MVQDIDSADDTCLLKFVTFLEEAGCPDEVYCNEKGGIERGLVRAAMKTYKTLN